VADMDFIQIIVISDGQETTRYVNRTAIHQIYEKNNKIFMELVGYETLEVKAQNIHVFMDRFVK
jgi:hypothetical protein